MIEKDPYKISEQEFYENYCANCPASHGLDGLGRMLCSITSEPCNQFNCMILYILQYIE